jgi:hypothetical protein
MHLLLDRALEQTGRVFDVAGKVEKPPSRPSICVCVETEVRQSGCSSGSLVKLYRSAYLPINGRENALSASS